MITPQDFSHLLNGSLTGLSSRMVGDHLALYTRYVDQWNAVQAAYPMTDWGPPNPDSPVPVNIAHLIDTPVAQLDLEPVGSLAEALNQVQAELAGVSLLVEPNYYLGNSDWWTPERAVSVNVPWFLANPTLWRLAQRNRDTSFSLDQVLRGLRHETGHAVGYAYELWKTDGYRDLFGDTDAPYPEHGAWGADPQSLEHVSYLTFTPAHYAQKHPDEDFAETFAAWLDPTFDWRAKFAEVPKVMAKFEWVDAIMHTLAGVPPIVTRPGKIQPYHRLQGTVGELLGFTDGANPFPGPGGWSEHAALLRRDPYLYNAVVLHEAYFRSLVPEGTPPPDDLIGVATEAFGSWDSYLLDLRAIAGNTHGWAVTVWDPRTQKLRNTLVTGHDQGLLAGCPMLLAIDCWEHAYAADYGIRKDLYLGAVFRNLDWARVAARLGL